jgi:alpha-methylacyl-CoA racemase
MSSTAPGEQANRRGPLAGLRVIEMVGLGPGPFCGMLLADLGADVLRVDRVADAATADRSVPARNTMHRGKRSIALDVKQAAGVEVLLALLDHADAFIDVFRPGVCERLGFGPDVVLARNPGLIYGRLTGWGQDGPLAPTAGHDIDYIAVAGALEPLGRKGQPPTPPINVLGDFAGGGMLLAFGIMCAAFQRASTGQGQVIDAAMVDGAALMLAPFYPARASGGWGPRGTNTLDTGAHFYDTYECADGKWLALGAVEPHFYAELLRGLGLDGEDGLDPAAQYDASQWDAQRDRIAGIVKTKARDEWSTVFAGTDACVAPVLDPVEAAAHEHARARAAFVDQQGLPAPAPAPRFAHAPAGLPSPPHHPGADTDAVLAERGYDEETVTRLREQKVVA